MSLPYSFNGGFVPPLINSENFRRAASAVGVEPPGGAGDDPYYEFGAAMATEDPYYAFNSPEFSSQEGPQTYYFFPADPANSAGQQVPQEQSPGDGVYYFFPDGYAGGVTSSETDLWNAVGASPGPRIAVKTPLDRPLRVVHVGPHLLHGGAEQWLLDLAAVVDPGFMQIVSHIAVHGGYANANYIAKLADVNISVEVGGREAVQRAIQNADVLLSWGVCLDQYVAGAPRPLSIQIVHGEGSWSRLFVEGSRQSVDHFVAVSHRVAERVCYDVPNTVIYNGIDNRRLARTQSRQETRRHWGLGADDFLIAFCGRLAAEKRVDCIIKSLAFLPPQCKLLVIGTGHLEGELRQLAATLVPGRVIFTSSAGGMGDLYAAADAFCMASNQEGCSLALLEAMLSGLPAVTTPVGCATEIIEDKVTGLLFDGSPRHLASALGLLHKHQNWRQGLAIEGQRTVESFGFSKRMSRDYEHLIRGLI